MDCAIVKMVYITRTQIFRPQNPRKFYLAEICNYYYFQTIWILIMSQSNMRSFHYGVKHPREDTLIFSGYVGLDPEYTV